LGNRFLYLVRHGEATGDRDDSMLTEVGQQQASLVGERLRDIPFSAIHHSPLPRAVQTAQLIAGSLPGVPLSPSDLLGDYVPAVPDPDIVPQAHAWVVDHYRPAELAAGPALAAAAIQRYAVAADHDTHDTHELIITHNFVIGWFVRHALDAPDWRWFGLNQANGALAIILYRPNRPPSLLSFNEMGHLPMPLRWTGFPLELRI
jgi:serine/threonine-protein phosphatase PGAM5